MIIHKWKYGFFIRLKSGRGIYCGLNSPVLFSERSGSRKVYRFGRLAISFFK